MTRLFYGAYEHPIMPVIVMTQERLGAPGGAGQAWRRRWDIRGELIADGPAAIQTLIDALESAYAADGSDLELRKDDGSTVLEKLDHSDSLTGVRVAVRPEHPDGSGAQYATYRTYRLAVEAEYTTAAAYSSTAWGGYTTALTLDVGGQTLVNRSGEYTGPGRAAAANAAKLAAGYATIAEEQTDDADRQVIRFNYQYRSASGREVMSYVETVQIEQAVSKKVARLLLDGSDPLIQETVLQPASVTQSGQAVGLTGYPSFPALLFSSDNLVAKVQDKGSPKRFGDGSLTEYPVSWRYSYIYATTPAWQSPGTPPA